MASLSNFGGSIKAVHRGSNSTSTTVTIPAVNMSKSFMSSGFFFNGTGIFAGTASLSSSTSVSVSIGSNGGAGTCTVTWEVVEFF